MANRESKLLKAWVRYDGNGEIIPSSIIYRKRKPAGKFKELIDPNVSPCCTVVNTTTPSPFCQTYFDTSFQTEVAYEGPVGGESNVSFSKGIMYTTYCNNYSLEWSYNGSLEFPDHTQGYAPMIVKRDPDGNIIWSKAVGLYSSFISIGDGFSSLPTMAVDRKTEEVYVCFSGNYVSGKPGIVKLDTDGNIIWGKVWDASVGEIGTLDVWHPKIGTNGYLYILGETYNIDGVSNFMPAIWKVNAATGEVEARRSFELNLPPVYEVYGLTSFDIDKDNNIVIAMGIYYDQGVNGDQYPASILKLDQGLNPIWCNLATSTIDRYGNGANGYGPYIFYYDGEMMDVRTDRFGGIYSNGWYENIIKFNPDGSLGFDFEIISTVLPPEPNASRFLRVRTNPVDDKDNFWLYGEVQKAFFTGNPSDGKNVGVIVNCDLSGNIRWATSIELDTISFYPIYLFNSANPWSRTDALGGFVYFRGVTNVGDTLFVFKLEDKQILTTQSTIEGENIILSNVTDKLQKVVFNDLVVSYVNVNVKDYGPAYEWTEPYNYTVIDLSVSQPINNSLLP